MNTYPTPEAIAESITKAVKKGWDYNKWYKSVWQHMDKHCGERGVVQWWEEEYNYCFHEYWRF